MKYPRQISGRMKLIPFWPVLVLPIIIILAVVILVRSELSGAAILIFLSAYILFSVVWMLVWQRRLIAELTRQYAIFDRARESLIADIPVPCALTDSDGLILWSNGAFAAIAGGETTGSVTAAFPQLAELFEAEGDVETDLELEGGYYRVERLLSDEKDGVYSVTFFDETELRRAGITIRDQKPVVAQVSIDNYDEATASAELVRRPLLAALIERRITKYFMQYGGIAVKTDKDKFTVWMNHKCLEKVKEDKFSLLEDVKGVNIGNEVAATISIGVGEEGEDLDTNSRYAVTALDLCLGRGGDQAVIKSGTAFQFFGGKVEHTDKTTKVKARTIAHALREILNTKERVLIMGHTFPDADSLGAAAGVYRIARALGKEARIVIGSDTGTIDPMLQKLKEDADYGETAFVDGEQAQALHTPGTLVVLVDTNSAARGECPEILSASRSLVIIDHHRQGSTSIMDAVLSYIEPYASSASELVTEIIQYISDDLRPIPVEADALYAGIIIDTDSFLTKTGVRTFEAAAYLRRCGADMTRVRKLFRDGIGDFKAKADTVSGVEIFEDCFAIGRCMADGSENPTMVGAQAANELLGIKGIRASLVFTPYNGQIYISARSIDEINVQLIMEKLGGGGHLSVAGAQLECGIEEAVTLAKETIKQMLEEGEL